jgi:hypothetical protein
MTQTNVPLPLSENVHKTVRKEWKLPLLPIYVVYSWTEQWGGGSLAAYYQHKDWAMRFMFLPFTRHFRGQLELNRSKEQPRDVSR